MPNTYLSPAPFIVNKADLVFYCPKIVKALNGDRNLLPALAQDARGIQRAKLNKSSLTERSQVVWRAGPNPNLQRDIEDFAGKLLDPNREKRHPTPFDAQRLLEGFVKWIDRSKYTYNQSGSFYGIAEDIKDSKVRKLSNIFINPDYPVYNDTSRAGLGQIGQITYNLFASVKSPVGNCSHTAQALALIMFLNGFPKDGLGLATIRAPNGKCIIFKGESRLTCRFLYPSPNGSVIPIFDLATVVGGNIQGRQLTPRDGDQPFDNHVIVSYDGVCYDPLYRCSYNHPDDAFDVIPVKEVGTKPTSPAPGVCNWESGGVWQVEEENRYLFGFTSPKISKTLGIPSANKEKYMAYTTRAGEANVLMNTSIRCEFPITLGRVFGWCVPVNEQAMRDLLMVAVLEYERGLGFFRCASDRSIEFVKKARVFCNKMENVPTKIFNPTKEKDGWAPYNSWKAEDAPQSIYDAMYVSKKVGDTLKKCLWKAFEVPSYFRT
jgi:hypothetical protein